MPKPTFDIAGYRARLGLTQAELGELLHMSDPARAIAAWESHQRTNGRADHGPSAPAIAYMELLERLWRLYHSFVGGTAKKMIGLLLNKKMLQIEPARGNRWSDK